MKVLTITLHSLNNPGSVLQAFALQSFLLKNGYNTEIIDYRPQYILYEGNKIKALAKKILFYHDIKKREKKFDLFINNYLKLTANRFYSYEELKNNTPVADCYITGSDQLWNSSYDCGRDVSYYLGFVNTKYKLSYAVSAGKRDIPEDKLEWIYKNIKKFYWVSVRENSTKINLEKKGMKNIDYVCDPVLLLDKNQYLAMKEDIKINDKYIAVYLVQKSEMLDALIKFLKNRFNYKIVLLGGTTKRCKCDIHITDLGPKEFLGWIEGAEFIIASSFHATVFSTIFQKKFAVLLPNGNGTRIEQYLEMANIKNRVIRNMEDIPKVLDKIEYNTDCTLRINSFITYSKKRLLGTLNKIEKELLED